MKKTPPHRFTKMLIGSFAIVSLGVILLAALLVRDMGELCGNTVQAEIPSPDGQKKIILFERNCGATTSYSNHGTILKKSRTLKNTAGNTFVIKGEATASWTDNSTISIKFSQGTEVFRQESLVDGISIKYHWEGHLP